MEVQIDKNDMGIREKSGLQKTLQDEINLPGSMPEKLKGRRCDRSHQVDR